MPAQTPFSLIEGVPPAGFEPATDGLGILGGPASATRPPGVAPGHPPGALTAVDRRCLLATVSSGTQRARDLFVPRHSTLPPIDPISCRIWSLWLSGEVLDRMGGVAFSEGLGQFLPPTEELTRLGITEGMVARMSY
jgi:hypothetical protein